jgi:plasmid stability protein
MNRAAIVVGVNRTGGLAPLASAVAEADRVAAWLQAEGFKVKKLTDARRAVTSEAVAKAVESFVTPVPQYHLLVVYFSGHGYWQDRSDLWLLSGAPTRPHEAINLRAAVDLARYSGIPNVVFISDACRSMPNARGGAYVDGIAAFPNYDDIINESKIDSIKATSEARPAYEGSLDGEPRSVLTAALLSAYEEPEPGMVMKVVDGGRPIEVVPNRQLEGFLQRKVDALMARVDRNATQTISVNVPSAEDVYIARVRRRAAPPHIPPVPSSAAGVPPVPPPAPTQPRDDGGRAAAAALHSALSERNFGPGGAVLPQADVRTERSISRRLPDPRHDHFESQTGFVVRGVMVHEAVASVVRPDLVAECLDRGDGVDLPAIVRVRLQAGMEVPGGSATSVALRFADGRCVVLAALAGYIGHATVKPSGLASVSYVPSTNHRRWSDYLQRKDELDRLRAMVALAVDRDAFQLRSEREAQALADRIRVDKAIDPSLGLYAAQAFAQAGKDEQVASVREYMRYDIGAELYDVRLLISRRFRTPLQPQFPVVPFCPLLTQNWNLLAGRGVHLPESLVKARRGLCDALWTTFDAESGGMVLDAIVKGALR